MTTGNDTWKWALVFILLAIFLVTANQAYNHIANQEDFAPPTDYLEGDSWDLEHGSGPGAGQAMQMPENKTPDTDNPTQTQTQPKTPSSEQEEPMIIHEEEIDWNNVDNPAGD
ncbi:MAG: hypothetical protein ACQETH_02945 [Candidatus Rifleibacteriota bacterium]